MARINWAWIPKKRSQILQIEQIHIGTNQHYQRNPREIFIRFRKLSQILQINIGTNQQYQQNQREILID